MTELGLIYDRADDIERARHWYQRAKAAGSEAAAGHPADLQRWQVREAQDEARNLDREVRELAKRGEIGKAIETFERARGLVPSLPPEAVTLNQLCWFGSLNGRAVEVIGYCDLAVAADEKNEAIRDSRGLARALTGDLVGAAEDFRFWVEAKKDKQSEAVKRRQAWIPELEAGRNPIGEAELEALRNE